MTGLRLDAERVAEAVGARITGDRPGMAFGRVSTDTRTLQAGDLFVAIEGERFDAHDFLDSAAEKGAAAAVVRRGTRHDRLALFEVDDTTRALGDLAADVRRRHEGWRGRVVALTGSNGKTTTKEMLTRILSRRWPTLSNQGNFNNLIGLPLTLLRLEPDHRAAVLEMGMNRPGEIARLTEIADPDLGLLTNIGSAHMGELGGFQAVARAKGEMFEKLRPSARAAINLDDQWVLAQASRFEGEKIGFGFHKKADVRVVGRPGLETDHTRFTLATPDGRVEVRLRTLGEHNVLNALAAAAAAWGLGAGLDHVAAGLADFEPFPGRLEPVTLPGPIHLLDDTYNASPESMAAAMKVLRTIGPADGRTVLILGDMLELGRSAEFEHKLLGRAAALMDVGLLVAVGPMCRHTAAAAREAGLDADRALWFPDAEEAAPWVAQHLQPQDRVLIKGSRGMRMERVRRALEGAGKD